MPEEEEEKKPFTKVKLTKEQSMSTGASFHASDVMVTAQGARVVLFGGQRTGLSEEMWIFDPADGWAQCFKSSESAPWPAPRTQTSLNSIGPEPQTRALLFGGYVMNRAEQNDLWACDIEVEVGEANATWNACESAGEPPEPRYGHSATIQGTNLVIFGGQGGKDQFNDVHVLDVSDPAAYMWSQPTISGVPPSVRSAHLALPITKPKPERVLIHGGFNRDARCLGDAYFLKVNKDGSAAEWAPCDFQLLPGQTFPRAQHAGAMLPGNPNFGYIFGGYDGARNLQDLLVFSLDFKGTDNKPAMRDVLAGPAPEARCRHTAHAIGSQLFVIGGYNGTLPWAPDVWTLDTEDAPQIMQKLAAAPAGGRRRSSSQNLENAQQEAGDGE